MYWRDKNEHYDRIDQRISIFQNKSEWKWKYDFAENLVNEHVSFYTEQWFSKEEAWILIKLPDRVREFFWLKTTLELFNFYHTWNYSDFFQIFINHIENSNRIFTLEQMEFLTEQLNLWLKSIKSPYVKNLVEKILEKVREKEVTESKSKIDSKLNELSSYFFMDRTRMDWKDLSLLLATKVY